MSPSADGLDCIEIILLDVCVKVAKLLDKLTGRGVILGTIEIKVKHPYPIDLTAGNPAIGLHQFLR